MQQRCCRPTSVSRCNPYPRTGLGRLNQTEGSWSHHPGVDLINVVPDVGKYLKNFIGVTPSIGAFLIRDERALFDAKKVRQHFKDHRRSLGFKRTLQSSDNKQFGPFHVNLDGTGVIDFELKSRPRHRSL